MFKRELQQEVVDQLAGGLLPIERDTLFDARYLQGLATDDGVSKELNKPDQIGVKMRAREEPWKKLGY